MENKVKITAEIPTYLKKWVDGHDLSQNALVVNGLRQQYFAEQNANLQKTLQQISDFVTNKKIPF